jgi:hypothetical protein
MAVSDLLIATSPNVRAIWRAPITSVSVSTPRKAPHYLFKICPKICSMLRVFAQLPVAVTHSAMAARSREGIIKTI